VRDEMAAAYQVDGALFQGRDASSFRLGGSFERAKAADALVALLDHVRALRGGELSREHFERAKQAALGDARAARASNVGLAGTVAYRALLGLDPADIDDARRIETVTPEDVIHAARLWLADDRLRVVVLGDASQSSLDLARLGLGQPAVRDIQGRVVRSSLRSRPAAR
jgi:zinc protease